MDIFGEHAFTKVKSKLSLGNVLRNSTGSFLAPLKSKTSTLVIIDTMKDQG